MKCFSLYCFMLFSTVSLSAQVFPQNTFTFANGINGFIENKGQIKDQSGSTNTAVCFLFSSGQFNLQLRNHGFSYELFEPIHGDGKVYESGEPGWMRDGRSDIAQEYPPMRSCRIDIEVIGAHSDAEKVASDPAGCVLNYYTTNTPANGITGVQSYKQVMYKDIYDGIDLVFTVPNPDSGISLKYEWILHPGADYKKIKLRYSGAALPVEAAGEGFTLTTTAGIIAESKVIAFREDDHSLIESSCHIAGNVITYNVVPDKNRTIVIDPNILWSGYFGGNSDEDNVYGKLTTDAKNKVIITGATSSTQFLASNGSYQTTYGGAPYDAYVAKFGATGKLNWATYYGSDLSDKGIQVAASPSNDIYLAGWTKSPSGIATPDSHQPVFGGAEDIFIVKFDEAGIRQWCTYYGGSYVDEVFGLLCDDHGYLYFTGYTLSYNQVSTPGVYQEIKAGAEGDAFIGKINPDGNVLWCTYFGATGNDRGHGIAIGNNGDLFMQGTTTSTSGLATNGAHQGLYGGGINDGFLSKWDTNGNFLWCSYFGGEDDERGREVVTDNDGNVYAVGMTSSKTNIATDDANQADWYEAYIGNLRLYDGYIAKFHHDGSIGWSTYYGGNSEDQLWSIAIDRTKNLIYAGGRTLSSVQIATPGSFLPQYTGATDGCLAAFTADGAMNWGTYIGASGAQDIHSIAFDGKGFLYLYLRSDMNSSATPGAYQLKSNGGLETVIVKFNVAEECYDSYESNNTIATAVKISAYSDTLLYGYTGAIADSADEDWFNLKTTATSNLKIVLTDLVADYDLKLYKANGLLLFSSANPGTTDETIIYNNAPKASYRLEIAHSAADFDSHACYKIKTMTSISPWNFKHGKDMSFSQPELLQAYVYPNPCAGQLSIKLTAPDHRPIKLILYNLVNQPVGTYYFEVEAGTKALSVSTQQLSDGIYRIELEQGRNKISKMVVVQK